MEAEMEDEEIWGEEDIVESEKRYETLTNEGFRHGKQSTDEISRQSGFNSGFKLGSALGRNSGHFFAQLTLLEPNQMNEEIFDILYSLTPDKLDADYRLLDEKLEKSSESVRIAYNELKSANSRVLSSTHGLSC